MHDFDLIQDILQRVADKGVKLKPETAASIDAEVRTDWGGQRHYIPRHGESGRAQLAERDRQILASLWSGCSVPDIARAWGISKRRVRQIGHL
jgi:Mor family transcriptional regulator